MKHIGRPKSETRKLLEQTDLISEINDSTLQEIGFKYGATKDMIQVVLTKQL